MEKKGFKWQIFLAALLLLMQSAVLLMPWLQITGDRFVSVAMEINREAEQIAAGKAREAGTTTNVVRPCGKPKPRNINKKQMKHYMADRTALMDCIWRDGV